jgi:DNA polymerase/3'-5' exonuclease PolX
MLELGEVRWKPSAYDQAACSIEDLSEDVFRIYEDSA